MRRSEGNSDNSRYHSPHTPQHKLSRSPRAMSLPRHRAAKMLQGASVDVTAADWRHCDACGGVAVRRALSHASIIHYLLKETECRNFVAVRNCIAVAVRVRLGEFGPGSGSTRFAIIGCNWLSISNFRFHTAVRIAVTNQPPRRLNGVWQQSLSRRKSNRHPARNPPPALVNRFRARRLCRVPPRGRVLANPAMKHSDGDGEPRSYRHALAFSNAPAESPCSGLLTYNAACLTHPASSQCPGGWPRLGLTGL